MATKKQTIKLKKEDLKKLTVKNLKKSVWELKQVGRSTGEQVHQNPKYKKPKYKQDWEEENL